MNSDSESEFSHSESEQQSPLLGASGNERTVSPPARTIQGRRLSLSPQLNPDSRDNGPGDNGDPSVSIDGSGDKESSPEVEAQIATWLTSAAAIEGADNQSDSKDNDILANGAGVRFVPGDGVSTLQAASPRVKVTLSSLQEQDEDRDENKDNDDDPDMLATPASLLPIPSNSPPPKLTPMQDRVADWPYTENTWPNNTRACMNFLTSRCPVVAHLRLITCCRL